MPTRPHGPTPPDVLKTQAMQAQYATTRAILAEGRTPKQGAELFDNALTFADHFPILRDPDTACAPGCWWCCTVPVGVTPLEALGIAAWLEATHPQDLLAALRTALAWRRATQASDDHAARVRASRPCVFLSPERQCSIYAVRPLPCRGWTSTSREACERAYATQHLWPTGQTGIPQPALPRALATGVQYGLQFGQQACGVPQARYDLTEAVLLALETPDGLARYLAGEAIFAALLPLVPEDPRARSLQAELATWYHTQTGRPPGSRGPSARPKRRKGRR